MSRSQAGGITLTSVLVIAFGVTLGLWLVTGYRFARRMEDLQRGTTDAGLRYVRAQDGLALTRRHVLVASVHVRDAVLDSIPSSTEHYRRAFETSNRAARSAIDSGVLVVEHSSPERQRVHQLKQVLDDFQVTMRQILGEDATRGSSDVRGLLEHRIVVKRDAVLQASEQFQAFNRQGLIDRLRDNAVVYSTEHRRAWEQLGAVLLLGLAVAVVATAYARRLERRLRLQCDREAHNTQNLQRLSSKLVQVQEEERRVIARELHDEVGQVLTAIKAELALAQRSMSALGFAPELLERPRDIADTAIQTVRALSRMLHPAILDDLGLLTAIESNLREFGLRHGIQTTLHHEGMSRRLPHDVEVVAYRAIQEALTNIARHAHASRCSVLIRRVSARLTIAIDDDGCGVDAARLRESAGIGLIGIRERVSEHAGSVSIENRAGGGTTVTIHLVARDGDQPKRERVVFAEPHSIRSELVLRG